MKIDLKGYRTYIFAALFLILAVLTFVFHVVVPEYVFAVLGALGLGFLRIGIADVSGNKGWKTIAASVAVAIIAVAQAAGLQLPFEAIYSVLGALGIIGVRDAVGKI